MLDLRAPCTTLYSHVYQEMLRSLSCRHSLVSFLDKGHKDQESHNVAWVRFVAVGDGWPQTLMEEASGANRRKAPRCCKAYYNYRY